MPFRPTINVPTQLKSDYAKRPIIHRMCTTNARSRYQRTHAAKDTLQEAQLMLTNRATRLEVSQCHQTWYHSIC